MSGRSFALASSIAAGSLLASAPAAAQGPQWRPGIPVATDVAKLPLGGFAEYGFSMGGRPPWRQKFSLVGRDARAQHIEAVVEGGPLGPGSRALVRIDLDPRADGAERVKRLVMRAGDLAPMEFPAGAALPGDQFAKLDPRKLVGDRSVTVPAGTFKTRYYKEQLPDGETVEYWVDQQVVPFGIVKMQASFSKSDGPLTMQLLARGAGARAALTEPARPHDLPTFNREVMTVAQGGPGPERDADDLTVINNVHVVDMTGDGVRESQTVVVKGDRIVSVDRRKVKMPEGTQVIDGTGQVPDARAGRDARAHPAAQRRRLRRRGAAALRGQRHHHRARHAGRTPASSSCARPPSAGDIISPTLYLAGPSFNGQSIELARGGGGQGARAEEGGLGSAEGAPRPDPRRIRRHGPHRPRGEDPLRGPRPRRRGAAARHRDGAGDLRPPRRLRRVPGRATQSRAGREEAGRGGQAHARRRAPGSCPPWPSGRCCKGPLELKDAAGLPRAAATSRDNDVRAVDRGLPGAAGAGAPRAGPQHRRQPPAHPGRANRGRREDPHGHRRPPAVQRPRASRCTASCSGCARRA